MNLNHLFLLGLVLVLVDQSLADTFRGVKLNAGKPKDYIDLNYLYQQYPFVKPTYDYPDCPAANYKIDCSNHMIYRKPNGECNNLKYKWWGAAFTPYQRLLEPEYTYRPDKNETVPRISSKTNEPLPNVRLVTTALGTRKIHSGLNFWFTFFGQLLAHDLAHTGESPYGSCKCGSENPECFNIWVNSENEEKAKGLPDFFSIDEIKMTQECIPFTRSNDVKHVFDCAFKNREHYTISTHFIDLDNVYGASDDTARNIRTYAGGLLKYDFVPGSEKESLPVLDINQCIRNQNSEGKQWKSIGCIFSGDERAGDITFLTAAHLLFTRTHNYIAKGLYGVNKHWSDETLYQEAKKINIAIFQNIVYSEYLPILLGPDQMEIFGLDTLKSGYSYNYDDYLYPNNYNEFVTAGFRLHQTIHTDVQQLSHDYTEADPTNRLVISSFRMNQFDYYERISDLFVWALGFGTYVSNFQVTAGINHMLPLVPDNDNHDRFSLPAFNVQRGRDHGIPGYAAYRKLSGGNFPDTWEDISDAEMKSITTLKTLYETPQELDLWIGLIAEVPDNDFLLPPLQRWLVAKNFFHSKFGDRFYFENGNDEKTRFTEKQLDHIRTLKISNMMCIGFGDEIEYNKIPEYGFFIPKKVFDAYVFRNPSDNTIQEFDAVVTNNLRSCDLIPKIDFNLWKDTRSYY